MGAYRADSWSTVITQRLDSNDAARDSMRLQEVDDLTRLSCDVEIARIGKREPPVRREFFHFPFPCFPPYFQVLSLLWRARGTHPR